MADFRTVQTRMWREDEWFQNLETDARLLWVYLFTNPSANAAGLYRLPIRTIAFESGIELSQVERLLGEFAEANKAHYEAGIVYVVKMQALQHGDISWQVATRIAADVDTVPDGRLKQMYLERYGYPIVTESTDSKGKITRSITYRYPIDTPSIPHRYTDTHTDTDTPTDTDRGTATAQAPEPPAPPMPADASASSGKRESERLKKLNGKLSPELRTPIANVVLDITGKRALADAPIPTLNSERILADAHEAAIALHGMGYKTESQVLALEPAWAEDWRGKQGGSFAQFVEFASERLSARGNGKGKTDKHGEPTADELRRRYAPAEYADVVQS